MRSTTPASSCALREKRHSSVGASARLPRVSDPHASDTLAGATPLAAKQSRRRARRGCSLGTSTGHLEARDLGWTDAWFPRWAGEDSNLRPTDYESAALTN